MNLEEIIQSTLEANIKDFIVGIKTTAVVSEFNGKEKCGIATTLSECSGDKKIEIKGKSVRQAAELLINGKGFEKSIAMAAINSALPEIPSREINATEIIIEKSKNKKVAVIGHFPFVEELKRVARELKVSEINPKAPTDITPEEMNSFLSEAEVIVITGLTLLNQTFDEIISLSNISAFKILLGPSVPLHTSLLKYVDVISGVEIYDIKALFEDIKMAKSFKHLSGKKYISIARDDIL